MKIAGFDIETTGLEAVGAGVLVGAVIEPLGQPQIVLRADQYIEDLGKEVQLLSQVVSHLLQYDLLIGHNIINYDLPWLRTRMIHLGVALGPMRPFVYDTMQAFKRLKIRTVDNGFGKPTARLGHVLDFFHIPQVKTAIYPAEWWLAVWGNPEERRKAIDEQMDHCSKDVWGTMQSYQKLLHHDSKAIIRRWA